MINVNYILRPVTEKGGEARIFIVDDMCQVWKDEGGCDLRNIRLSMKEYQLLKHIIMKYPTLASYKSIRQVLWPTEFGEESSFISGIRTKFNTMKNKIGTKFVAIVRGSGYFIERDTLLESLQPVLYCELNDAVNSKYKVRYLKSG